MNVGLCWMGSKSHRNDANRSLPRGSLRPLAAVEGITWHCLARDGWAPELADFGWVNALESCQDWLDTARVVQGLDLVISVDTAVAHLAGGLGVPTWIVIAAVPDMRWMLERSDTPWYASVRLYRQLRAGDWMDVLVRVAEDLEREVHARRMAA